jgi:alkanesulfonate monooxygenase SsuD/methylene tetrahydromethanopterin reductase-like flavin-dependent oxidoreductase (luciferase family)
VELAGDGSWLSHDERYEAASEFLHIWKGVLAGDKVNLDGKHIKVSDAQLLYPPVSKPYPPLYFGGSSDAAHDLAAEHVDVYLSWGEPPAEVARRLPMCGRGPQTGPHGALWHPSAHHRARNQCRSLGCGRPADQPTG